ncbi:MULTISPECIES: protein YibB [Citrobacter]|nr:MULTISPECIES: protein YibB [Citrobacter]MBJ8798130.1 protein YibB [Citrobacter freundii]MCS0535204.1 protein YibB [Citrobacter portucalensis]MDM2887381.1 protein YibB [Citrobacter sp. Cpo045]MDM2916848.1 protein YibB [Citrobacter sp. Cpo035]MDV1610681.1 protein YibB [Citrobacter portucalensis]
MNSSITIVTAFFDIGRGSWTSDKGFSPHLERTSDTYIQYFKNLSELDNDMIIFTSKELKSKIEKIRDGKRTTVIAVDINKKFRHLKNRISQIQKNDEFRSKLETHQLINPEYWSADYVLVCNLKTYFVNRAIKLKLVKDNMIAWVDFGYCRNTEVTNGLSRWSYPFDRKKINLFTIKKGLKAKTIHQVFDHMINNRSYIIGGAIVATQEKWKEFYELVCACQMKTLKNNIVDDDQGIFIMCYHYQPKLIKLNYLGKNRWFNLFKLFGRRDFITYSRKLKVSLIGK